MPNTSHRLLKAAVFAAEQHQYQRRAGYDRLPYLNHLLKVAEILARFGETNETLLLAALFHDILEDTPVTQEELAQHYGANVAGIVAELTDDMSLPYAARKELQLANASSLSKEARKIRLADKGANLRDIFTYPIDWPVEKKAAYLQNSRQIAALIKGENPALDQWFDQTADWAGAQLANTAPQ
ncbi:HD domain-containing protein [Phaeodactylibacter luteus]|uniref:Bifunctional (P)ppGpp synthetase/guanosine-3',5'-bis(Diphosphate) 3'-pyrophosphohydrolase n=1 Tax=Phaeodactylibacter luteus TaxID=1564516 RepID=A0A5C6RW64_9BACT|nr:HD domain-containing protein [Phaeodactylibacter luteus]TXB65612.1 bifunctional (p)ppGpp synthetase/guanosine-3',5'-bis(diphosphate) 3'-pyrophosphohydrolase [Phaeodactylibacter luteus]